MPPRRAGGQPLHPIYPPRWGRRGAAWAGKWVRRALGCCWWYPSTGTPKRSGTAARFRWGCEGNCLIVGDTSDQHRIALAAVGCYGVGRGLSSAVAEAAGKGRPEGIPRGGGPAASLVGRDSATHID